MTRTHKLSSQNIKHSIYLTAVVLILAISFLIIMGQYFSTTVFISVSAQECKIERESCNVNSDCCDNKCRLGICVETVSCPHQLCPWDCSNVDFNRDEVVDAADAAVCAASMGSGSDDPCEDSADLQCVTQQYGSCTLNTNCQTMDLSGDQLINSFDAVICMSRFCNGISDGCETNKDAVSILKWVVYNDPGSCFEPPPPPCKSLGTLCSTASECCSDRCIGNPMRCSCIPNDWSCSSSDDCCSETCSGGICVAGGCNNDGTCNRFAGENCSTCPNDCGVCCPDGLCNYGETCSTCPADCGACGGYCGDGFCNGTETCSSCPGDCGVCTPYCPDGLCNYGETCSTCSTDCGICCGDGSCNYGETCSTCSTDCGSCCGDGSCNYGETCSTCPADCGSCAPTSVGHIRIWSGSTFIKLNLISAANAISAGRGVVKVARFNGDTNSAADLVLVTASDASPVRIRTPFGTYAWREL